MLAGTQKTRPVLRYIKESVPVTRILRGEQVANQLKELVKQTQEKKAAQKKSGEAERYYTLSGDVNSDMVNRVFAATAKMTQQGVTTAHLLIQSHGGYVSDGICLYNYLRKAGPQFITYNCGAVASIAVIVFLAGARRIASDTARFMIHKAHSSPPSGSRSENLRIIADGLIADDLRTEAIMKKHLSLSSAMLKVYAQSDVHITAADALKTKLIHEIGDFSAPAGSKVIDI